MKLTNKGMVENLLSQIELPLRRTDMMTDHINDLQALQRYDRRVTVTHVNTAGMQPSEPAECCTEIGADEPDTPRDLPRVGLLCLAVSAVLVIMGVWHIAGRAGWL